MRRSKGYDINIVVCGSQAGGVETPARKERKL